MNFTDVQPIKPLRPAHHVDLSLGHAWALPRAAALTVVARRPWGSPPNKALDSRFRRPPLNGKALSGPGNMSDREP